MGRLAEVRLVHSSFAEDTFLQEMEPILKGMRLTGMYPSTIRYEYDQDNLRENCRSCGMKLYSLFIIGVNLAMFGLNLYVVHLYKTFLGIMHVETMTAILTGLKPFQATLNLLVFNLRLKRHQSLLSALNAAEKSFSEVFGIKPKWSWIRFKFMLIFFLLGFVPFCFRLLQYILMGEVPLRSWLSDISIFLVAVMSLCQCVPLLYFHFLCSLIRFWFKQLQRQLKADGQLIQHNITFYYSRYLQLTKITHLLGEFLNPFIFFSLAVSVVVLCLTIYFFINSNVAFEIPPNATKTQEVATYFLPAWAGLQIATAIVYILCVSVAGMRTNEESRKILGLVLSVVPPNEEGKFQVLCWVQKIQTQYSWCLTVWRAFPIERGLLFTLISMIATYAVVLLKLQQSIGCEMTAPVLNESIFQ